MNALILTAALLAQLEPSNNVTVRLRSIEATPVSSYISLDPGYSTLAISDTWVPLVTNSGPTILTVNQHCGCIAMSIASRMAYIPCDFHVNAVRLVLPKDAPTK